MNVAANKVKSIGKQSPPATLGKIMQVVREPPCQRRHHRIDAPLIVSAPDGVTCNVANWSLGGLKIQSWSGRVPKVGDKLKLALQLPFQGFDIAFDVEAQVVRVEEDGSFAGEFTKLPQRAEELMQHFIEDLIRGKMASVEDTICRIDVPVTPISTKPDANPKEELPVRRWSLRTLIMSCFYLVAGIAIFAYAALLLYSNLMRIEVKSAVVSAPLFSISMPVAGKIVPVNFKKGQFVRRGDLIARIDSPALSAKIEEAKLKVTQATDDLIRTEQKAQIERERMRLYQLVSETDHNIELARIEAHRAKLNAADRHYYRMKNLAQKGHVAVSKLDEAKQEQMMAASELREAEQRLQQSSAMKAASKRRHYNHKIFVVDLDMVDLEVSRARTALNTAQIRLANLVRRQTNLLITAPVNGEIVALFTPPNILIERNTPLLTIEQTENLTVTAFLSQDEVLNIGMNDPVSVLLPAYGEYLNGTIISIDRNASSLKSDANHYQWNEGNKRTAIVSIQLNMSNQPQGNIRAGLPAVVVFERRSNSAITAQIANWLSIGGQQNEATRL